MNEKIKELAEQAEIDAFFYKGKEVAKALDAKKEIPVFNEQEVLLERFAELLIEECAMVANRAENNECEIRSAYEIIKSHFGKNI